MGHQEVAALLEQNLMQEQEMARKVEQLAPQLGQQPVQQMGERAPAAV